MIEPLTVWDHFWEAFWGVALAAILTLGFLACGVYVLAFEVVPAAVRGLVARDGSGA